MICRGNMASDFNGPFPARDVVVCLPSHLLIDSSVHSHNHSLIHSASEIGPPVSRPRRAELAHHAHPTDTEVNTCIVLDSSCRGVLYGDGSTRACEHGAWYSSSVPMLVTQLFSLDKCGFCELRHEVSECATTGIGHNHFLLAVFCWIDFAFH